MIQINNNVIPNLFRDPVNLINIKDAETESDSVKQVQHDKNKRGFTLLELVIAMAIMAILAVGLWANFTTSILKGKDSRRKQDLDNISRALELYYQDYKAFPTPIIPAPSFTRWGLNFVNDTTASVIYMSKVPQDPGSVSYCYESDPTGTYFKLFAKLENGQDPQLFPTPIACDGVSYNYGISSTNVSF